MKLKWFILFETSYSHYYIPGSPQESVAPDPVPEVEENEKHKAVISNLTTGQSALRNIEGVLAHRDLHYHGLKNVQTVFPQESNGFQIGD
jgi:hypothetical protein